jgi:hypothetical protein
MISRITFCSAQPANGRGVPAGWLERAKEI